MNTTVEILTDVVARLIAAEEESFETRALAPHRCGRRLASSSPSAFPRPSRTHPAAALRGEGQGRRIWDVDGNEYVDFHNGFGGMVVGHTNPLARRLRRGHGEADRRQGVSQSSAFILQPLGGRWLMDLTPLVLVIDDTPQKSRLLEAMLSPRDAEPPTRLRLSHSTLITLA
jgi:hypothetical protein